MEFGEYMSNQSNFRAMNKSSRSDKEVMRTHSELIKAKKRGNSILRQELRDLTPECTIKCSIICNLIIMLIFCVFSIPVVLSSEKTLRTQVQYDNCTMSDIVDQNNNTVKRCQIQFTLNETYASPVFIYYRLQNYYSNDREYVKSRSWVQLRGGTASTSSINRGCSGMEYNYQAFGTNTTHLSVGGYPLNPNSTLSPCGNIAKNVFTDNFTLSFTDSAGQTSQITIDETNIARMSDRTVTFKRASDYLESQWIDVENEHFMVWMSMETFTEFDKRWGTINEDLASGTYTVTINNVWPTANRGVTKYFVLSKPKNLGSASYFGYALVLGTCISFFSILYLWCLRSSQKLKFDEEDLKWN